MTDDLHTFQYTMEQAMEKQAEFIKARGWNVGDAVWYLPPPRCGWPPNILYKAVVATESFKYGASIAVGLRNLPEEFVDPDLNNMPRTIVPSAEATRHVFVRREDDDRKTITMHDYLVEYGCDTATQKDTGSR